MFRVTCRSYVSPYVRFLIETKGWMPQLPALERAAAITKLYKDLDETEKAALAIRARNTKQRERTVKKRRQPNPYNTFVRIYTLDRTLDGTKHNFFPEHLKQTVAAYGEYKKLLAEEGKQLTSELDLHAMKRLSDKLHPPHR